MHRPITIDIVILILELCLKNQITIKYQCEVFALYSLKKKSLSTTFAPFNSERNIVLVNSSPSREAYLYVFRSTHCLYLEKFSLTLLLCLNTH